MDDTVTLLREHGIRPTAQRIAVAEAVLGRRDHPTADMVWETVRRSSPTVSRATVYNTLNLFAEKGLVRSQVLQEGSVVFDPNVQAHHHFIDEETGEIHDIPWDAIEVKHVDRLEGLDVREFHVVIRGRKSASSTTTGRSNRRS